VFTRRDLLKAAGATAPLLALPIIGCAEDGPYPSKNITFIIPHGAGGGFDTFVRIIGPAMSNYLPNKVNILPTNVSAGGGGKGVAQLYRAAPDGYTIGIVDTPGVSILQRRQDGKAFDLKKFTWLCTLGQPNNYALAVSKNSPLKSIDDLLKLSAERPVKFCTSGPDGTSYLAAVISTQMLNIRTQFITGYKGSSDFIVGTLRGDGDAVIAAAETIRPMYSTGDLRVLATFERESSLGDVPTAISLGHEDLANINAVRVVGAPPNLPEDIKSILSDALNKAMVDPQVQKWAESTGYVKLTPNSPEHATKVVLDQEEFFAKWEPFLKHA